MLLQKILVETLEGHAYQVGRAEILEAWPQVDRPCQAGSLVGLAYQVAHVEILSA